MAIFMLSHLFSSYFILTELYFNPILSEKENSPSILFVFYFYFKPIFKQVRKECILGDPGADSGGEGKSKRAEK